MIILYTEDVHEKYSMQEPSISGQIESLTY